MNHRVRLLGICSRRMAPDFVFLVVARSLVVARFPDHANLRTGGLPAPVRARERSSSMTDTQKEPSSPLFTPITPVFAPTRALWFVFLHTTDLKEMPRRRCLRHFRAVARIYHRRPLSWRTYSTQSLLRHTHCPMEGGQCHCAYGPRHSDRQWRNLQEPPHETPGRYRVLDDQRGEECLSAPPRVPILRQATRKGSLQ